MLEAARDLLLKALGALLPTLLGWFYKPSRIDRDIKIRPNGEGEAITFYASELPNIQIWLQVTNLSPFTIEIDRLLVQVAYGTVIGEYATLRKTTLKPASEALVKVESALTTKQVSAVMAQRANASYATLYITAYVNCKVHNLELTRSPQTTNIRVLGVPSAA
jgi:hypothetical protein